MEWHAVTDLSQQAYSGGVTALEYNQSIIPGPVAAVINYLSVHAGPDVIG